MRDTLAALQWGLVSRYVDLNQNQTVWTQAVKSLPSGPPLAPIATGNDAYNGTFPVGQVRLPLLHGVHRHCLQLWSNTCGQLSAIMMQKFGFNWTPMQRQMFLPWSQQVL